MISFIGIMLLTFTLSNMPDAQLKEVREMFYKATESKKVAEDFREKLLAVNEKSPVLLGYKGMAEMLMANYSYNPINKISYFNKGKALLERSIDISPENSELRFLRFSIQTNAPSFLGYKASIESDKEVILNYLQSTGQDKDLEERMRKYMLENSYCTEEEKNSIK